MKENYSKSWKESKKLHFNFFECRCRIRCSARFARNRLKQMTSDHCSGLVIMEIIFYLKSHISVVGNTTKQMKHPRLCDIRIWWVSVNNNNSSKRICIMPSGHNFRVAGARQCACTGTPKCRAWSVRSCDIFNLGFVIFECHTHCCASCV